MNTSPDVCVLGAGIVGLCTALSLADRGLRVRLVDQAEPGQQTSSGNAGIISPWSVVPQSVPGIWKKIPGWLIDPESPISIAPRHLFNMIPWGVRFLREGRRTRVAEIADAMFMLTRDCIEIYRDHLAGTGQQELITDSYYVHAFRDTKQANPESLEYRLRQQRGAIVERIPAGDLHDLEPALSEEFQAAILIKGQARARSPARLGEALGRKFVAMGGEIVCEQVTNLRRGEEEGWVYSTETGDISSAQIVIALGVWSAELLRTLGIHIPLEAERGYNVSFQQPQIELRHSVMDMDLKVVASSMDDGLRLAGIAEFSGIDTPANHARLKNLEQAATRMLPMLASGKTTSWSGQRPSMPDSLPCLGGIRGMPGLFCAFGHSHYGLMMAPKTGEIIADLICGRNADVDLSPFHVCRYS